MKKERIYLVWWDNGQVYSDWSAEAEIVSSALPPDKLREKLLSELPPYPGKLLPTGQGPYSTDRGPWDCRLYEYIFNKKGQLVLKKERKRK
jgi:hypothetical protein